tara:strand:+ start:53 stop:628 length:576 start_codon:yes stop_codon:yes gene_type:complete
MTTEFDLIRRYRGAFTSEECKKIIKYIDNFEDNNILIHDDSNLHRVDHKTINISYNFDFPAYSQLTSDIMPNFKPCVDEYLQAFSILNGFKWLLYDLKVKKIPIGGGFHQWHFENGSIPYSQRKFVVQLYLNDDFEGGETEFLYQNRRELAREGDVIIFPAGYTHTHRGNPPIGNTKYIVTSWGLIQDSEQ